MSGIKEESSNRCFGGFQKVYSHESKELKCPMKFSVYVPQQAESGKVPVVFWLSGLTCTEQNFIIKGHAQQHASKHGYLLVGPDTSPRGVNIEGEDESYDFGSGAGFYCDATEEKWKEHYRMFSYVTKEFLDIVLENFNADKSKMAIMGHSMGGHGALICALKNPGLFKSVSAFSPITNPINCQWGQKAFTGYLGADNKDSWNEYDSCALVKKYQGPPLSILIDQGKADQYLTEGQLLPENFVAACRENNVPVTLRMQEDYDHSFFFVQTFLQDHFAHHESVFNN